MIGKKFLCHRDMHSRNESTTISLAYQLNDFVISQYNAEKKKKIVALKNNVLNNNVQFCKQVEQSLNTVEDRKKIKNK